MSPQTTRRWPRLSHLIFAAGCASASLTLTNFEDISDKVTLTSCRNAYNTPLTNCKLEDFSDNKACSTKCRTSITQVEDNIQKACASVSVDSNSLLYRAQKGQLEEVICNAESSNDDSTTTATQATTTSKSASNQSMTTSIILRKSTTTTEASTTMTAQTTSLVLAGDEPTGVAESAVSSSTASASATAKSDGRGGDPFATPQNSKAAVICMGYTTLVISATFACMLAVM